MTTLLSNIKHRHYHSPISAVPYALSEIGADDNKAILHICPDERIMTQVAEGLRFFAPTVEVIELPAWDCLPYDRVSPNHTSVSLRMEALSKLTKYTDSARVILTTVNALLQRLPAPSFIKENTFIMNVGGEIDASSLPEKLVRIGFQRTGKVMEPGEFAVRGGIIDVFPAGREDAVRLDFFGNNIESIRTFDPLKQISDSHLQSITLMPVSEFLLDEASVSRFRQRYREIFGAPKSDDILYASVSEKRKFPGMEHWLPLFHAEMSTIFDYVNPGRISFDHNVEQAIEERFTQIIDFYNNRLAFKDKKYEGATYNPLAANELYLDKAGLELHLDRVAERAEVISFSIFSGQEHASQEQSKLRSAYNFAAERGRGENVFDALAQYINQKADEKKKVVLAFATAGSLDRTKAMLTDHGIITFQMSRWADVRILERRTAGLAILGLESGFESGSQKANNRDGDFIILSEQDILGTRVIRKSKRKRLAENFLQEAASFDEGELIVHRDHGIGRFEGLINITAAGANHDCLKIIYRDGDKLFVPVENIELISRFGEESEGIPLDKLGAASWQARKARLKERIKIAAEELLKIAAERELRQGDVLEPGESDYNEFCARFPFTETEDQLAAIEDTLNDLKSGRPTDRLICGDVGFGKTEVALRAAFAVVCSKSDAAKQVAIVCPTTLLARQHYKNFKKRFEGMPVEIRQLSRLVSSKDMKESKEGIKNGVVDIAIGTHALLAKSIEFKNLSLLIIDEEQHFGVGQKERLKQLKSEIHVISLSATPIPRTLQMSLAGIRDLSLITTPPVDRLAVRTFVMPFDAVVIREAILRERYRGGKIFYVSPRLKDLAELRIKLTELVPEIRIAIAHGQMPASELDKVVNEFYEGKFDLLLSTNIVESGLDVPDANTIIIHRADLLGLSQLYQLRGRVGRGKIRAYAYLTLPYGKSPTRQAERRLEVMQNLDTLGAGFTVASHDMDIRGYGNLVGEEQSGHVKEVGVELYQQMLEEAIIDAKRRNSSAPHLTSPRKQGEENLPTVYGGESKEGQHVVSEDFSPQINLGLAVSIPEDYIADLSLRMGLYRRVGGLKDDAEVENFALEMIDRFGLMPDEVKNLLEVIKLRLLCKAANIEKLDKGPKGMLLSFHNNLPKNPEKLLSMSGRDPARVKIRPDQKVFFEGVTNIATIKQLVATIT
jgi:transcription-repair coupling factor (superfamily II helicase)